MYNPVGEVKWGETGEDIVEGNVQRESLLWYNNVVWQGNEVTWGVHASSPAALICMTATGATIIMTRGLEQIICEAKEDRAQMRNTNRNRVHEEVGDLRKWLYIVHEVCIYPSLNLWPGLWPISQMMYSRVTTKFHGAQMRSSRVLRG